MVLDACYSYINYTVEGIYLVHKWPGLEDEAESEGCLWPYTHKIGSIKYSMNLSTYEKQFPTSIVPYEYIQPLDQRLQIIYMMN